ncbi:MAG: hypothetical protein NTV95_04285 [Candidatus Saccharibacteria bacterium]|nr:hypothetical protein [Candidatus Saccharibacteria bacterium]
MTDNSDWLQRVVVKLYQLHMSGSDFVEELWEFDWNDKLSKTDNFKNIAREERALTTLTQVGAIQTIWKENFYRDQHWESMERHGWSMWSNWDTADPALRLYDNIWYVVGFDYDRFRQFCEAHGFTLAKSVEATKKQSIRLVDASRIRVEQTSYDPASGVLNIMGQGVAIIAQKNKHGKKNESKQAKLMRQLFDVNTFPKSLPIRKVYPVRGDTYPQETKKKARELVAAINRKVGKETSVTNLINCDDWRFQIASRYLKN